MEVALINAPLRQVQKRCGAADLGAEGFRISSPVPQESGALQCSCNAQSLDSDHRIQSTRDKFRDKENLRKHAVCRHLRHRYRDSNPGFRTENPVREAIFGRFGAVLADFEQ